METSLAVTGGERPQVLLLEYNKHFNGGYVSLLEIKLRNQLDLIS